MTTLAESLINKHGLHKYKFDVTNVITDVIDKVALDVEDEIESWSISKYAAKAIKHRILMAGNDPGDGRDK